MSDPPQVQDFTNVLQGIGLRVGCKDLGSPRPAHDPQFAIPGYSDATRKRYHDSSTMPDTLASGCSSLNANNAAALSSAHTNATPFSAPRVYVIRNCFTINPRRGIKNSKGRAAAQSRAPRRGYSASKVFMTRCTSAIAPCRLRALLRLIASVSPKSTGSRCRALP